MAKSTPPENKNYMYPHPDYSPSKDRAWLKDRMKYPTGFCSQHVPISAQGHEGTKPFAPDGSPARICTFWQTCPCTCHQKMDQLYETMGMERQPAEQTPEYLEVAHARMAEHDKQMREIEEMTARARLSNGVPVIAPLPVEESHVIAPDGQQRPVLPPVARPVERSFGPTPTGRRAKGQLEYDVLRVCVEYTNEVYDWIDCTPKLIAERIAVTYATEPPSTGAINAVWDRWEKLGFAEQAKKPSRFLKFTEESEDQSRRLDRMKVHAKGAKRRGQAEAARAIRPAQSRKKK